MAISFSCSCGKSFRAKDEHAGRRLKCPGCGVVLAVPLLGEAGVAEDGYHLAEPDPGPAAEPAPAMRFGPRAEVAPPATPRPRSAPGEEPRFDPEAPPSSLREYLYWALLLALIPLVVSVLSRTKESSTFVDRFKATIEKAPPEVQQRIAQLFETKGEGVELEDLLTALPGHRLAEAHLPRDTGMHWIYGALAATVFWVLALAMFPREKRTPGHLLSVGLFTGTLGIVLLLVVQYLAAATQGVWIRGRGIVVLLFYIAKFIGFSYASASDPDTSFALSVLGFTCGVGLCEELCKALPLIGYYRRDAQMGWRGACLWGLASGIGFGVAEGIMYSARYYNGITSGGIYLVRFVSCVALHAIWTAAIGITMWRRQETIQGDREWPDYALAILRILAVPMVLHGLYDTLLKKDLDLWALAVGAASFAWFAWQVEAARTQANEPPKALRAWA
ncbi:MAG: PrsW family intramembrane metalloprotease [Isosphaeraceae bacterium]|nr:PrsW family intramembrane metalloprotease [Isosphaeraceae bacterium]